MEPDESENPVVARIGLAFARALAEGRFRDAHVMLAPSLRDDLQPPELLANYEDMTSYWDQPADHIEVSYVDPPGRQWPGKEEDDLGWAFVSIDSLTSNRGANLEQVCVRVVRTADRNLIAQIVWGRP